MNIIIGMDFGLFGELIQIIDFNGEKRKLNRIEPE